MFLIVYTHNFNILNLFNNKLFQRIKKYVSVEDFSVERTIKLDDDKSGFMYKLNYPLPMHFTKLRYKQRLLASIGHNVQLQFDHVIPAQSKHYHYNHEFFK